MGGNYTPATSYVKPIIGDYTPTLTSAVNTNNLSNIGGGLFSSVGSLLGLGGNVFENYLGKIGKDLPGYNAMSPQEQAGLMAGYNAYQQGQGPGLMDTLSFGLGVYNMFNTIGAQNDYMDLMKEQLGMAREQWGMTKDEVNRIGQVRNNLNAGYQSGNYAPSPTSKTNY